MAGSGRNNVGKEEDVIENTLCGQTQRAEPDGRLAQCHERHQVHALVLGLFQ